MKKDHQIVTINELTGLEIAKYLLSRLVKDDDGIKRMAEALDYDEKLVSEVLDFFRDIGWIRQNTNGTYEITTKANKGIE
jgi:DNA-binding IclR family transcriptional regulator